MKKRIILLIVFIAALYLTPAIFRPLAAPEEFRCAEIAREMLERGNFIVPKVLDARYFESPPMYYWFTAASFKIFGENAFALRLVSILGAVLSAALLGWWCLNRKYSPQTAINAAFLFLSGALIWGFGSFGSPMLLSAMWIIAAWIFAANALETSSFKQRIIYLTVSGIAMGCGFLTKGISAFFIPAISLLLYLAHQHRWRDMLVTPWIPIASAAAVILPWGVMIHNAEPDFWNYFLTNLAGTFSAENSFMRYIALAFIFIGILPGVFPVLSGISAIKKEEWPQLCNTPEIRSSICFMLVSMVIAILFAPAENFIPFVFCCFGGTSMLGTMLIDRAVPEKWNDNLRKLTSWTALLFITAGTILLLAELFYLLWGTGFIPVLPLQYAVWAPFVTTLALGMVIAGTIMFINRKAKLPEPESFFSLLTITALVCVCFFPGFTASHRMPEYELLGLGSNLSGSKSSDLRIITTPDLMYSTAWCFRDRSVQLLGSCGDMEYGYRSALKNCERPLMLTAAETGNLLKNPKRKENILIIMLHKEVNKFKKHFPQGEEMTSSGEICALYYAGYTEKPEKK